MLNPTPPLIPQVNGSKFSSILWRLSRFWPLLILVLAAAAAAAAAEAIIDYPSQLGEDFWQAFHNANFSDKTLLLLLLLFHFCFLPLRLFFWQLENFVSRDWKVFQIHWNFESDRLISSIQSHSMFLKRIQFLSYVRSHAGSKDRYDA